MQKCIVVSVPAAKVSAPAAKEDFKKNIKRVAELGYDAVELHIRDPKTIDVDEVEGLLEQYRLTVPTIGTGQAYGEEGLSFADPDPEIRKSAVERIKDQVDLAVRLKIPRVTIGLIRGTIKAGMDQARAEKLFVDCLTECLAYNPRVTLILEPINRYETLLYNDTASTREVIEKIGRSNLQMLIDTFHMNIEEVDIVKSIYGVKDHISHVHFADSNRWPPGCGHINFKEILGALAKIGYEGAISAEILPKPSSEESVRLTMECYRRLGL